MHVGTPANQKRGRSPAFNLHAAAAAHLLVEQEDQPAASLVQLFQRQLNDLLLRGRLLGLLFHVLSAKAKR